MIVLEAGQTLQGIAGNASSISYSIEGMELAAGIETYKTLAQGQLGIAAVALYTVPALTQAFIKSIHLVNTNVDLRTGVKLFVGGSAAVNQITGSITFKGLGSAVMEEDGWVFYDSAMKQLLRNN